MAQRSSGKIQRGLFRLCVISQSISLLSFIPLYYAYLVPNSPKAKYYANWAELALWVFGISLFVSAILGSILSYRKKKSKGRKWLG